MSNFLAIATVTAALQEMLQPVVSQAVGSAKVGFSRPDGKDLQTPIVNVYLYQTTPNPSFRNCDAPTRRSDGTLVQVPRTALDLHYLFTFHGNDDQLEPQRMLGAVVSKLNSQPMLSPQNIVSALAHNGFLANSNLSQQVERVKFTPTSLSLEEFSKLWSVFFQIEYSLSAAYQASVVMIESDDTPQEAPQVQERNLYVVALRSPTIEQVTSKDGPDKPIVAGSTLLIQGEQLRGESTAVLLENTERIPSDVQDTQITLPLPSDVHAGMKGLQIVQKKKMGTPEADHPGFESNVAPFVLRPTITLATAAAAPNPPGGTNVTLTLAPNIGVGQRAVLVLNNLAAATPTSFTSAPLVSAADSNQVVINIRGVPTGSYMVRVQIDGAESLPNTVPMP